jgi:hypothetical protein
MSPSTSSSRPIWSRPGASSTAAPTCCSSRRSSTPSTPRPRSSRSRRSSRSAAPLAGHHLRHHHRRVRAHPLRPDHRGLLELGPPRPAAGDRAELRARCRRDAPLRRGALPASPTPSSPATPTPGLPNAFGEYDETPSRWPASSPSSSGRPGQPARRLLRHHPGAHRRDRRRSRRYAAPPGPERPRPLRLAGLEPLTIDADSLFVNVGERTNITGSARFRKLIKAEDYPPRSPWPASRSRPAPRSSTSTWTRG